VLHADRWKCKTQKIAKKIAIWAPSHNLWSHIFATKARIDNRKKNFLNSNISSTCPHNMANFGPQTAEIRLPVWGTPANFNRFLVVSVSHTLRR